MSVNNSIHDQYSAILRALDKDKYFGPHGETCVHDFSARMVQDLRKRRWITGHKHDGFNTTFYTKQGSISIDFKGRHDSIWSVITGYTINWSKN